MSYDAADLLIDSRNAARRNGRSYTETVDFSVTRDGQEVDLTIVVRITGADRSTGAQASAEIEGVSLNGAPWSGALTGVETDYVLASFDA